MIMTPGFIRSIAASPIRCRVAGVSGHCSAMTSLSPSSWF
jgi:hypothetical protein